MTTKVSKMFTELNGHKNMQEYKEREEEMYSFSNVDRVNGILQF